MRILQVGLSYNPGGIESFVMNYNRALVEQGVRFDFISMFPKLAYEDEILTMGENVYHTIDGRKHPFLFYKQMKKILSNGQYDAVHINMLSAANIVPLITARMLGIKHVIAHSHNSSSPGLVRNILHWFNKPILSFLATDYFACSKVAAEWLFTKKVLKSGKVRIVHNAIDVQKFLCSNEEKKCIKEEYSLEDRFVIGHVGRFEEQKNHIFLIEVFKEFCKQNSKAILLLIGTGELEEEIRKKVSQYGIEKQVIFLGLRDDVDKIMKTLDVFLFPSLFEGLPLVLLEAQAAGVFCLVSSSITKDVDITKQMRFVSLKESAERWAETIMDIEKMHDRRKQPEEIAKLFQLTGYDITDAAKQLKSNYCTE